MQPMNHIYKQRFGNLQNSGQSLEREGRYGCFKK